MNDPGQHLVHLTSRGPKVQGNDGAVGNFKCYTTQPMKDINKFGLLHYSIPKMLDHVQENNRKFNILLRFLSGTTVTIPVTLPLLDYNNMYASQRYDHSNKDDSENQRTAAPVSRIKYKLAFDEVLQSTINWAIMEQYDRYMAYPVGDQTVSMKLLARISCICDFEEKTGTYFFVFGYRGYTTVEDNNNNDAHFLNPGVLANTGCPFPVDELANPGGGAPYVAAQANGQYTFISPRGIPERVNDDPVRDAGGNYPPANIQMACIQNVEFRDMSVRVQLMLGASVEHIGSGISWERTMIHRGRIRLVNYTCNNANEEAGLPMIELSIPPNLDPPNLLYLQLTVPGTKTRVLGQNDERGGWAIPTPQNQYVSKHNNLPTGAEYHKEQARYIPRIGEGVSFNQDVNTWFATESGYADGTKGDCDGVGYNFDPFPRDALDPLGGPVGGVHTLNIDNWSNTDHAANRAVNSTMIRFRDAHMKFPRSDKHVNDSGTIGFGIGVYRASSCFCSTMILPNYIFTSTEDATIQTFDIQLLWGDTCDPVTSIVGQPVQFSIIASP